MSSAVDICNLGLSHLGDAAEVLSISPPDDSIQAAQCARFYPLARDVLLEMHPWTFATKRMEIAAVDNPSPDDWAYAYALPTGCIRPLSCLFPGVPERLLGTDADIGTHPYIVEAAADGSAVLYTNVQTAVLRFIAGVTDTTKFTPGFVNCLARLLSSYLAGPIYKGPTGMKMSIEQMKLFQLEYARATALDANAGKRSAYETRQPSWIAARGIGYDPLQPWPNR